MSCFTFFVSKLIIYIANLVTASGAVVLIVIGVQYTENEDQGVSIFGDFLYGVLSLTVGAIALITCIFGCIGVCLEKPILIKTYAGILMGLFTIQLSLGVMGVTKIQNPGKFTIEVTKIVQRLFDEDQPQFNVLQREFQCCGVYGYSDFNKSLPASCCETQTNPCLVPFQDGCATAFRDVMEEYIKTIGFVAIVFAAVELMCAFFALTVKGKPQSVSENDDNWY